jgi:hypothetical protein
MRIVVCIKQVPDSAEVRINPETNTLIRDGVPTIINPYDVHALEAGLQIREKTGGKVTVLTMGPPQAETALREALAMGADEAVLLTDRAFAGSDTWATAYTLTKAITAIITDKKHEGYLRTVEGLAADCSLADIAAASLCLAYGEPRVAPMEEAAERGEVARLFMTIGRKDKISVSNIVKAIASGAQIPGSRIGKIDVHDSFTFVEVPAGLADMVIHSLDDMMMMGRRISVKQAKARNK